MFMHILELVVEPFHHSSVGNHLSCSVTVSVVDMGVLKSPDSAHLQ